MQLSLAVALPKRPVLRVHVAADRLARLRADRHLLVRDGARGDADQEVAVGSQACEAVRGEVYPEDWALWKRHCQG